mgnify:CR=1 FL=1
MLPGSPTNGVLMILCGYVSLFPVPGAAKPTKTDDQGRLTVAEATPEAYRVLGQFQVIEDAHDAWAPMALADGRLVLRDLARMKCLKLAIP